MSDPPSKPPSGEELEPLYRRIYDQLRREILVGKHPPGSRLPASRRLAADFGVARMTVQAALAQLITEGVIVTRPGAGTFVSEQLPVGMTGRETVNTSALPLSEWGLRLRQQPESSQPAPERGEEGAARRDVEIDFGFSRSFAGIFPYDVWRRLLGRYLSTDDAILSRYGSPAGFDPLRQAIASHVARLRGVRCTAEQIVIVNGSQQALDLLARLLLSPGDEVLVEAPGYPSAHEVFTAYGATLVPLPVDEQGFDPAAIPTDSRARLVFVTPSNQFPQGGSMPAGRQLALLDWCRQHEALVIEDDYDGELRYEGQPLAAMQGLDTAGRVIYLGTFSKVLFPALRLGYVVLPPALRELFLQARQLLDRGAPTLTQAAVADFITEGHFDRHLRRLRQVYGSRRETLVSALHAHLGDWARFTDAPAGLHLMVYLPVWADERRVIQLAAERGVAVYPGRAYQLRPDPPPSILLGFSGLDEDQIELGVARLAAVLEEMAGEAGVEPRG